MRIRKNRHWASDVAAGAGIGILATELGYCITDALFRNKGLDITGREDIISNRGYKPSFVGIRTGFNRSETSGSTTCWTSEPLADIARPSKGLTS